MFSRHRAILILATALLAIGCGRSPDGYPTTYEGFGSVLIESETAGNASWGFSDTAVLMEADGDDWRLFVNSCWITIRAATPGAQVVHMNLAGEADCTISAEDLSSAPYSVHFTEGVGVWSPSMVTFHLIGETSWEDSTGTEHDARLEMRFESDE